MNQEQRQSDEQPVSVSLWDDPVVQEVRAIRRRLWEEAGRDINRYLELSRQAEQRRRSERPSNEGA